MKNLIKPIFVLTLALVTSFSTFAVGNNSSILDVNLGVEFTPSGDDEIIGLSISRVFTNGVGEAMGLKPNDVLLGVGNQPISLASLDDALSSYKPGDDVLLRIKREGKYKEINVKMPNLSTIQAEKGYLGVDVMPIASKNRVGAVISYVSKNSTADLLGLSKGDMIMGVNEKPVIGENMKELMEGHHAGDLIAIRVERNGKSEVLKTVLGSAPANFAKSVM